MQRRPGRRTLQTRPPATSTAVSTSVQRRVKTLHKNTGTATWGFMRARPRQAPLTTRLRSASIIAAMLKTSVIRLNCVRVRTPPQQRNIRTGSAMTLSESCGRKNRAAQYGASNRHHDVQQHPDRMRNAERQQAQRRQRHDAIRRVRHRPPVYLVDIPSLDEPGMSPPHHVLEVGHAVCLRRDDRCQPRDSKRRAPPRTSEPASTAS